MPQTLAIGLIGAGANTRLRHIPGFRALPDAAIAAVANRTAASAAAAAGELGIPRACATWRELVADPGIDAVCIGTWPDSHAAIATAALAAGKHVLCEARMARTLAEARSMESAAAAAPGQVAMLVPAPFTLAVDDAVRRWIGDGAIGRVRAVSIAFTGLAAGPGLHWRQQARISGVNTLALGIWYEALLRWLPPARRVAAISRLERTHGAAEDGWSPADVPDRLLVLGELADGAALSMHGGTAAPAGCLIEGDQGAIRIAGAPAAAELLRAGAAIERLAPTGDGWRVEAEFADAIRTGAPVRRTSFADGVRGMAFTDAVDRAAAGGGWVAVDRI